MARVELGASDYSQYVYTDGQEAVGIGIFQLPGTNAIATADAIYAKMNELKKTFPPDVDYSIPYDTTIFVRESIQDVVKTLLEAVLLVVIVVIVFLQNWRAAVIPLMAIPVSLIGTFAVMYVMGFSLNNLSLFGIVLAIGIVVDDAIVVVENIERWIEKGVPAEAGGVSLDGRSDDGGHRHRVRIVGGVRAHSIHLRLDGPVLQTVCTHDRLFHAALGVQLSDSFAGDVRVNS